MVLALLPKVCRKRRSTPCGKVEKRCALPDLTLQSPSTDSGYGTVTLGLVEDGSQETRGRASTVFGSQAGAVFCAKCSESVQPSCGYSDNPGQQVLEGMLELSPLLEVALRSVGLLGYARVSGESKMQS